MEHAPATAALVRHVRHSAHAVPADPACVLVSQMGLGSVLMVPRPAMPSQVVLPALIAQLATFVPWVRVAV